MSTDETKTPDREQIEERLSEVVEVTTSDAFIDQMLKVREAPAEERLSAGAEHLTPEALREAGADIPEGFRVSSRYFDEELDREVEFGDTGMDQANLITRMEAIEPGFLDRVRINDPNLFDEFRLAPDRSPMAACGCAGVGPVCAGAGW